MKKLLYLIPFIFLSFGKTEEQPPFQVDQPNISENFRQIYYLVDQQGNLFIQNSTSPTSSNQSLNVSTAIINNSSIINGITVNNSTGIYTGRDTFVGSTTIKGTTTNDNAALGNIGEYISAVSGTQNCPTTNQFGNNISITLSAGDWDVSAIALFFQDSSTIWTQALIGIGTVSGNDGTGVVVPDTRYDTSPPGTGIRNSSASIPCWRTSISATTTYYLKIFATYSAGTAQYSGKISARRIR